MQKGGWLHFQISGYYTHLNLNLLDIVGIAMNRFVYYSPFSLFLFIFLFSLFPPSQLLPFFPFCYLTLTPRWRLHREIPIFSKPFSRGGKRGRTGLKPMLSEAVWEPAVILGFLAGVRGQGFPASCPACAELFWLDYKKQHASQDQESATP
jgi:hypothetical protein